MIYSKNIAKQKKFKIFERLFTSFAEILGFGYENIKAPDCFPEPPCSFESLWHCSL